MQKSLIAQPVISGPSRIVHKTLKNFRSFYWGLFCINKKSYCYVFTPSHLTWPETTPNSLRN